MKMLLNRFAFALALSCIALAGTALANPDTLRLETHVVETLLVPENSDSLSWERVFPKELTMPRSIERAGAKGCAIFSFDIDTQGSATNIETESVVPNFGLRRLAKEYLESWQWKAKTFGAIEEKVLLRLDFCIGGATTEEASDICEYQATLPCSNKKS